MSRKPGALVFVVAVAAATLTAGCPSQPAPPPAAAPQAAAQADPSKPAQQADAGRTSPTSQPAVPPTQESGARKSDSEVCRTCGVVTAVETVEVKGEGTGVGATIGAVVGGVAGGVLGHQVGGGKGKDVATAGGAIGGAAGGALAGHEIEKRARKETRWVVKVHMDDGDKRQFTFGTAPAFQAGQKVKVLDGALVPAR